MTREFLSTPSNAPATAAAPRATPVPTSASTPPSSHPLAGAFPPWDLVPAAPFVRRVK